MSNDKHKMNLRWDVMSDTWGLAVDEHYVPVGTEEMAREVGDALVTLGTHEWV